MPKAVAIRARSSAVPCQPSAGIARNCRSRSRMGSRISRCVGLLQQDQGTYYDGPHSGHVLTHAQGRIDTGTWADYMNVGMEHGCFDMTGLAAYMRGMVDAGPTRSGHRTPTVIVEAPVNGLDAAHVGSKA